MKGTKYFFLISVIYLISGCGSNDAPPPPPAPEVPSVQVTSVRSDKPTKPLSLPGELHSWNKVSIHAKVKGFIKEIKVDRGSKVKKGDVIAILDAPEVLAELDKASGELAAAKASSTESKSKYELSKLTLQRLLKVSQTPGAIAPHELDKAKAQVIADSSLAANAEGNYKAAISHYASKNEMARYLTITAPFDGVITERNTSPGALVGAGDSGSKPLFVLEDNSKLRLTVAIPESFTNTVDSLDGVEFTVNAVPGKTFRSSAGRSAQSITDKFRVMMTEFDVTNEAGELKAGMYADVTLPVSRSANTLFSCGKFQRKNICYTR